MLKRLAAALLTLTIGCRVPAVHGPSGVALPDRFSGSGGAAPLASRWWLALHDPALASLIDRALTRGFDLRIAWARLRQAEAIARGARAASLPSVDVSAQGSLSQRLDSSGASRDASATLGLAASYELDLWGRVAASRDQARFALLATRHDLATAALSVTAELATTWYQLVAARAADALLAAQIANSEATLALVTRRVGAGLAAADDQRRQEQAVESLRGNRALTGAQIAVFEHQLAILVGEAPGALAVPTTATLVALPPLPATGVPSEILQRRPDVRAAYARVLAADRAVAEALTARYPRLTLSARIGGDLPFVGLLTSLIAGLTAPLYDGGQLAAEVDKSRAERDESVLAYQQAVVTAADEVEDALVQDQHQADNLASLDKQVALSNLSLTAEQQRYAAGLTDYLSVLAAQETFQGLERQQLAAQATHLVNRIALYRALAGEWELVPPG